MTKAWPRALFGPIMCMARPRRPQAECDLVRQAAAVIHGQRPDMSCSSVAQEVAVRVVAELLTEIDGLTADPLVSALRQVDPSPVTALATCPEIDTLSEFVDRRVAKVRDRSGAYLSAAQQNQEKQDICRSIEQTLSRRYLKHLRR